MACHTPAFSWLAAGGMIAAGEGVLVGRINAAKRAGHCVAVAGGVVTGSSVIRGAVMKVDTVVGSAAVCYVVTGCMAGRADGHAARCAAGYVARCVAARSIGSTMTLLMLLISSTSSLSAS